jgi:hypothetical protein
MVFFRQLLLKAARKDFSARTLTFTSIRRGAFATTISSSQQRADREWPVGGLTAAAASLIFATWQLDRNKAGCCGIAGVVGTQGHDAR